MKKSALLMISGCLGAIVAHSQPLSIASPESLGMSAERLEVLETVINREITDGRMPGAVIAIARHGSLGYFQTLGYLDVEAKSPMVEDAIFSIASMTKPVFAVAALMLLEEGRLLLNEPVGTYLPELANRRVASNEDGTETIEAIRQPTIRDLMLHTSGFVSPGNGTTPLHARYPGWAIEVSSGEEYLEILSQLPLRYQPGTTWEYGPGLDILGLVMERITGQRMGAFLKARLFEPLGMKDTGFKLSEAQSHRQAEILPLDPLTGEAQQALSQLHLEVLPFDCGGGCLASTTLDYLAFSQMLLNGGALNGKRILGRKTVEYMMSDHIGPGVDMSRLDSMTTMPAAGYGYGLGGAVRRGTGLGGTTGSVGEYMWGGAYGTYFWIDPQEELVVVYMAQTPGVIRGYYRQLIPALVYQSLTN